MNSEPMLPTSASPVATPIRRSNSTGMLRTPINSGRSLRNFATRVERGETCEASLGCLVDKGWPPIGHYCVTNIFVDNTLVNADGLRHSRQVSIHHFNQSLWRHPLA